MHFLGLCVVLFNLNLYFTLTLEEQFTELNQRFLTEIATLKRDVKTLREENQRHREENQKHVTDLLNVRMDIENLRSENDDLRAKLSNLEMANTETTGSDSVDTATDDLRSEFYNDTVNEPVTSNGLHLRISRQSSETAAFHARLSKDTCVNVHEVIKFDDVAINTGGGSYQTHDGIYTVGISGTYVFMWTITSDINHHVIVEFLADGVVRGSTISDSDHVTDYHPATGAAIVHVNAGDHIYMRMLGGTTCNIISHNNRSWATVSGWLLM